MRKNPEFLTDAGHIQTYVLEWIARGHPDFLLPASCKMEGPTARISFHTEGLLTLAEYAGQCLEEQVRPAEWIISVLDSIRGILTKADDHLLDRSLFQLDIHSVWYKIQDSMADTQAAHAEQLLPILTYHPAAGAVQDGDLASITLDLLAIAEKTRPADHADRDVLKLKAVASHGVSSLSDYLDDHANQKMHPGESSVLQTQYADTSKDRPPPSGRTERLAVLVAWIVLTVVLAAIPMMMRFGPEPIRMFRDGPAKGYYWLVSAALGVMALADFLLLFSKFSPFHIPARKDSDDLARKRKYRVQIQAIKQEIRMAGLLTVITSRLGKDGRLGSPTSQVAVMSGSERLGFLSEGEPGTLSESQGIRAYLLTEEFLVGRDPDMADLTIPDASIGRVHARINRIEGVFFLTDLGSVNGTRLDGKRLDRHVQTALPDKCRINFAERTFYFIAD